MRRYLSVAALLLLAGCQGEGMHRYTETLPQDWQQRRNSLTALHHWNLQGRVRIRQGEQIHIGKIGWHQQGEQYELDIFPPIGGASHRLQGGPTGVTWHSPNEASHHDQDLGALMQEKLGWSVPLDGARYWVVGLPNPEIAVQTARFDDLGRLRTLDQSDWEVHIQDYQQVEHLELPTRLELIHRDGLELRLAIHHWKLKGFK